MAKKKLTPRQAQELREAYESWNPHDPNSESAADLAARFGISKQTLYNYRDEWLDEERRRRERQAPRTPGEADAIVFLTSELARARVEIERLERRVAELES